MEETPIASLAIHFADLDDPREASGRRHQLLDIIAIAICATICDADNWVAIAAFGQAKERWLGSFLSLTHGIPSYDTFRRVFALLDAEQFQESFMTWVQAIVQALPGQVIAVDGKTARAAHDGQEASTCAGYFAYPASATGIFQQTHLHLPRLAAVLFGRIPTMNALMR